MNGDASFATAQNQWRALIKTYPVSIRVQKQLLGYSLKGIEKTEYMEVTSEIRNELLLPDFIWSKMDAKLYKISMVSSQRT